MNERIKYYLLQIKIYNDDTEQEWKYHRVSQCSM